MTTRKNIDIELTPDFPELSTLPEFLDWVAHITEAVPSEYRETARVCFNTFEAYDMTEIHASVTYTRPETDQELAAREAKEREAVERSERMERQRYEELRKKYGP